MDKQTISSTISSTISKAILEIKDLCLRYRGTPVFENLDITFKRGESVLIAGRSGAGKSTLIKCLAGVYFPDSGEVIYGENISRKNIGIISDRMSLFEDFTLKQGIEFHSRTFGIKEFDDTLLNLLNLDRGRKIKHLSTGERVLFHLSLLISQKPEILLVDEVIHTIDPYLREVALEAIIDLMDELGTTVVMVNQTFAEIERIPERVLILEDGKIFLDIKRDLLSQKIRKVVTRDNIDREIPVIFKKESSVYKEYYIYPFEDEMEQRFDLRFSDIDLNEIMKAFIGGFYVQKRD